MTGEGSGEACAQVVKAERAEAEQCSAEQPWSGRRAGLGSSAWQADQSKEWEEDGVCPEGQEEALTHELCMGACDRCEG